MLDDEHRRPGSGDALQHLGDALCIGGVEAGGRFVQQQDFRSGRQRTGNLDQAAIDMGKRASRAIVGALVADVRRSERARSADAGAAPPTPEESEASRTLNPENICAVWNVRARPRRATR